ncbi:MAG: carboxypeptidase regulatory-like domain-containing protein [Vicinamibacterales bacterium]
MRAAVLAFGLVWLLAGSAAAQGAGTIRGTVVDTEGGSPIEDVSVRLQDTGATTTTDADGRFTFADVPPGDHELYISVVNFLLVTRKLTVPASNAVDVTIALTQGTGTYSESVSVVGAATTRTTAAPAESEVHGIDLQLLSGLLANDPLRAVQAMPGVTTGDDFRSEFAVRGAGPAQTGFIFDGISTRFMLHTVREVTDAGSIAMVNGEVIDSVSLRNGSYPQTHGNRTGAEVEFQLRNGSRDRARAHISVSAVDASAVAEGPLGRTQRGSWLVSARKSYLDLVLKRLYQDQTVNFGFFDAQAKLGWDLTNRQHLDVSLTGGRSRLDLVPDEVTNPNDLREAMTESGIGVLGWRWAPSAGTTLSQRAAVIGNTFRNASPSGLSLDDGGTTEFVYRGDVSHVLSMHASVDGGFEWRSADVSGSELRASGTRMVTRERYNGTDARTGAYVSSALTAGRLTLMPGVRVDRWSLTQATGVSPWMQGSFGLGHGLTVRGGTGLYRQMAEADQVIGLRGNRSIEPSRSTHADLGIEGRVGPHVRWQMTGYTREDRDWLRLPLAEVKLVGTSVLSPSTSTTWQNALDGYARGVEWLVERRAERGIGGWVSYAYGRNRYHDRLTGERFWGDYDQRHTFNAFASYRLNNRTSASVRFRAGSNTPAPGYWTSRGGLYYVSSTRNDLRVPQYARLDIRANRTFTRKQGRLTLFVEVLNVLNRDNERFLERSVNRRTLETVRPFESMLPLVPSAGLLVEF